MPQQDLAQKIKKGTGNNPMAVDLILTGAGHLLALRGEQIGP
jgi:hypothetical protein